MPPRLTAPPEYADIAARFEHHLATLTLSAQTRRAYRARAFGFLHYLADSDPTQWHGNPLAEPGPARLAAAAYKSYLQSVARRAEETVNAHLTAVDALAQFLGLGMISSAPNGRSSRFKARPSAPRALSAKESKRLLDYVALQSLADQALIGLLYYAGLRVSEVAALTIDDVPLTARTGNIKVREGKGGKPRSVPVARDFRPTLEAWREQRLKECADSGNIGGHGCPLFVGKRGAPLRETGIRRRVVKFGQAIGLDLTPHTLRHTYGTRMIREGIDVVTVAELMGHSRLETTRRYSAPTDADRQAAVDTLSVADVQLPGRRRPSAAEIAARLAEVDAEQIPGQTSIPVPTETGG